MYLNVRCGGGGGREGGWRGDGEGMRSHGQAQIQISLHHFMGSGQHIVSLNQNSRNLV